MKSHLLITAKYLNECLEKSTFGATSCNSLANVSDGDYAYLFSSKEARLVGPLKIISEQFRSVTPNIRGKQEQAPELP